MCTKLRYSRHNLHQAIYGFVASMMIFFGLFFSVFSVFRKNSLIGQIWLAGPTSMVVGFVLYGKVLIDWDTNQYLPNSDTYESDDFEMCQIDTGHQGRSSETTHLQTVPIKQQNKHEIENPLVNINEKTRNSNRSTVRDHLISNGEDIRLLPANITSNFRRTSKQRNIPDDHPNFGIPDKRHSCIPNIRIQNRDIRIPFENANTNRDSRQISFPNIRSTNIERRDSERRQERISDNVQHPRLSPLKIHQNSRQSLLPCHCPHPLYGSIQSNQEHLPISRPSTSMNKMQICSLQPSRFQGETFVWKNRQFLL